MLSCSFVFHLVGFPTVVNPYGSWRRLSGESRGERGEKEEKERDERKEPGQWESIEREELKKKIMKETTINEKCRKTFARSRCFLHRQGRWGAAKYGTGAGGVH